MKKVQRLVFEYEVGDILDVSDVKGGNSSIKEAEYAVVVQVKELLEGLSYKVITDKLKFATLQSKYANIADYRSHIDLSQLEDMWENSEDYNPDYWNIMEVENEEK